MFENLGERLERSFKILKGEGKITEINVAETLKDVRKALLDADVNYKIAKQFTETVKEKARENHFLRAFLFDLIVLIVCIVISSTIDALAATKSRNAAASGNSAEMENVISCL